MYKSFLLAIYMQIYIYLHVQDTLKFKKYIRNKTLTRDYANIVNST